MAFSTEKKDFRISIKSKETARKATWRIVPHSTPGVSLLTAIPVGESKPQIYSYRFSIPEWKTLRDCRDWLKSQGVEELRHSTLMTRLKFSPPNET